MNLYSLLIEHPGVWMQDESGVIGDGAYAKLEYALPHPGGIIARVEAETEYLNYVESNDQWADATRLKNVAEVARLVNGASDQYPVYVSHNPNNMDAVRVAVDWHAAHNASDLFDLLSEVGRMQDESVDVYVESDDCIIDGGSGTIYLNHEYIIDRSHFVPFDADLTEIAESLAVDPHETELRHAIVDVHPWRDVVEQLKRDGWTWLRDGTDRIEGCNGMYAASGTDRPRMHAQENVPEGVKCIAVVTNGTNPYETRWSYLIA